MIRVLIADDEPPARDRLVQMLQSHPGVEVVGQAETGIQAMELASALRPDLMILDIQMPGCGGLDVAASLPSPRPQIVFCTAFDQYAIEAFELAAVDYLLKPVTRVRLAQALNRVRETRPERLDAAIRQQQAKDGPVRFLVKSGASFVVVPESQVLYFSSDDGLTRLVTATASFLMDPTLNDLGMRLPPERFYRISRAVLVCLHGVVKVSTLAGGSGAVLLKNGQTLEVSRRRYRGFLDCFEHGM